MKQPAAKKSARKASNAGEATRGAARWSSRRSYAVLALGTVACLLPFAGTAFHIDDPLFL